MTEYKDRIDAKRKRNQYIIIGVVILLGIIGIFTLIAMFQGPLETLRAAEAKSTIEDIYVAACKFEKDNGKWPFTLRELEELDYWMVTEQANNNWDFYLLGHKTIRAISRYKMAGGAGKTVDYDIATDTFLGYGSPEEGEVANFMELIE